MGAWPGRGARDGLRSGIGGGRRRRRRRHGGRRGEGGPFLESGIEDDDIHAAIAGAALGALVVVNGVVFRKTRGGEPLGLDVIANDKEADEFGGAGSGKFPVGSEMSVVNRDVIGMAFDAQIFIAGNNDFGQAIDSFHRGSAHGRGTAIVKPHFAQADDQAFFLVSNLHDMFLDFGSEGFFKLLLNVFHGRGRSHGRENALHGFDHAIEFAGTLDVFHRLHFGKRKGFGVAQGNARVGGLKDAQLLESDLDGQGQTADTTLVHLGRGVKNDEKGEEQGDEIGVADDTVSNVINGVTLSLGSPSPNTPVTLNVSPDTTQITNAINNLVTSYNAVITEVNAQFNVAPDGSGGGPLEADNSLRDVQSRLLAAISYAVPGNNGIVNLASIGVNLNNDGTLSLDNGKLSSALSGNFAAVQNFLQNTTNGFTQNLSKVISSVNGPGTGILAIDQQSITTTSQGLTSQIADLQAALLVQQQNLTKVYSQVNTTLQELPLLQSQITQQLAGLK